MRIELVIDELRLHGFDVRHRYAVADAVEREAAALVWSHLDRVSSLVSARVEAVQAGNCRLGDDAGGTGQAIARAVMAAVLENAGAQEGRSSQLQLPGAPPERGP